MIPWIESHVFHLGSIPIQTWGTFVAAGFLAATWIAARRAKRLGLDPNVVWDVAVWIFAAAMVGSRVFHVLFYAPGYYLDHPLEAIDPRKPGYAIMGGILSGAVVAWWWLRRKGLDVIRYADTLAWGLPWGCGIGRIGCFLIHDHPGTLTSFVGGVKYPDGSVRHDLGLYLSILGFAIGGLFLGMNVLAKHNSRVAAVVKTPGFWTLAFFAIDGFSRFWLDFLRLVDRRIVGLTPTQWLLLPIALVCAGLLTVLLRRASRRAGESP